MIKKILIVILIILLIYPGAFVSYWFLRGVVDPSYGLKMLESYGEMSSDELIKKLNTIDPVGPGPSEAMQTLARRKEKEAVPYLIKYLNSWNSNRRYNAILALGEIGDSRGIAPLMKIVEAGGKGRDYEAALLALSELRYQGAYPYVLELAKDNRISAVEMLINFKNPESIVALESMKVYYGSDGFRDKSYRARIDAAIDKISKSK